MKLAIILVALMGLAAASYLKPTGDVKYFDKDMIYKQKFFLDVLYKVWEPFYFEEYKSLGDNFLFDNTHYTEYDKDMEYFYNLYKTTGFAPRGLTYSSFDKYFLKEVTGLFKFFYYAKDFETLQKNIIFARQYVNENVFVYALQLFVFHNEHYQYIVLPALYEIFPFYFYNGKFIYTTKGFDFDVVKYQEVYEQKYLNHFKNTDSFSKYHTKHFDWYAKKFHYVEDNKIVRDFYHMQDHVQYHQFVKDLKMFWIKADYSDKYDVLNEEFTLNYLIEDNDWNLYFYYLNIEFPFFLHGKHFNFEGRRGEYYFYCIRQILARYNAERYSQGYEPISEFSWYTPVEHGYSSQLVSYGGYLYSYRPNYYQYKYHGEFNAMNYVETFEQRFRDVIAQGYYVLADGTKFYFNKPDAVEQVALLLQGSVDSIDRKFFGSWMTLYHTLLGFGDEYDVVSEDKYLSNVPNVLFNFETMLRDPLFYQIYSRLYNFFYHFKYNLGYYKQEELAFNGVKIYNVTVDKFETHFDFVDSDVSVLLNKNYFFKDGKFNWEYAVFARRYRLNNKPFVMTYHFESDKAQKIVVRTFIGPKYDKYGKEMSLDTSNLNFYEIDKFYYEAIAGKNTYNRESTHFFHTKKDTTTYVELYKSICAASEGKFQFPVDYSVNKYCGFPERLIFPQGSAAGLPMKIYVIATPFNTSVKEYSYDEHVMHCGMPFDHFAYGFPLDRPINEVYFWQPNMYFGDVFIYHDDKYTGSEYTYKYFENEHYFF